MKRTIFLRVFLGYVTIILLLAIGVIVFAPPLMKEHHIKERAAGLDHLGHLLEGQVTPFLAGRATGDLGSLVAAAARETGARITVIDLAGSVLTDSEEESRDMENHLYRPEIQAALQGREQMSIRHSSTLNAEMMYMSVPLRAEGKIVGALRLSLFMKDFAALMDALRADLMKVFGIVTLIALVLAIFLARSLAVPIREVIEASSRVSAGDFDVTVSTRRRRDFRDFARSFNDMTGRLKGMFGELRMKSEEIHSIMSSIREGLCLLDREARITRCNDSFRRIVQNDAPEGRHFWEVIRSSGAVEIVRKARETRADAAGDVVVEGRSYFCSVTTIAAGDRLVVTLHDTAK